MTWTAPAVERVEPDHEADERTMLDQYLDYQRQTLLHKCAGLTAEQLKTHAVPTSGLTLLGIVRHMVEVERWWLRSHTGEVDLPWEYCTDDDENLDFDGLDDADAAVDLQTYRDEVEQARVVTAARPLDDVVPSRRPGQVPRTVRWIYVHMIEEYARHNGHADLLREALDGTTGE
jgi:uncharacterized damage-inducible protein DinB